MMEEEELKKIWTALDTRITAINDRTKSHTIQIRDIEKKIKKMENNKNERTSIKSMD